MKKRILIFSPAYLPFVGGAEIAVKEITDRLSAMPDAEFVMVTARLDPTLAPVERIGNILVHRMGHGRVLDKYLLAFAGHRFAEKLGSFDTVWAIMASYAGFAGLRYKKQHPNTRFVLTLQEGDSRWDIYKHVWWCWPYFKKIFQMADRIQAISTYLAEWATALGAACPVVIIPNGVDVQHFASAASRVQSTTSVITVSRLVKKNGVAALIAALSFLPEDVHLRIAGSGPLDAYLKRQAARLNLSHRIEFLGTIGHASLPNLLASARVFCRPSRSEGLGNAFLEAMAAGVPVVGTAVGGIPDFLTDEETGLLCHGDDPKDIAEKIQRIFSDAHLAKKLSDNGKKLVEKNYQWDSIADSMKSIL